MNLERMIEKVGKSKHPFKNKPVEAMKKKLNELKAKEV